MTFQVTTTVPVQNAGTSYTNTVTVDGQDDEHDAADGSASATVNYTDVAPSISVTAMSNVPSVEEEGVGNQQVTYTFDVTNTSTASTDPLLSVSLGDALGTPTLCSAATRITMARSWERGRNLDLHVDHHSADPQEEGTTVQQYRDGLGHGRRAIRPAIRPRPRSTTRMRHSRCWISRRIRAASRSNSIEHPNLVVSNQDMTAARSD